MLFSRPPSARQAKNLLIAALALCLLGTPVSGNTADSHTEFEHQLDRALAELSPDYEARLTLVQRFYDVYDIQASQQPSATWQRLQLKARLVEGIANLRLSRFELSKAQFDALCPTISSADYPNEMFRCESMQAALKLILGDPAGSLEGYEQLFSKDLQNVSSALQARARINYAAVLSENGRSAEAADLYESQMVLALSTGDDLLALFAGNNLVVILITQGDHPAARETLHQLEEVLERNPNSVVEGSLRLHELELMRVAGARSEAASGLRDFIRNRSDPTPLMMGSAHKILADTLRELGQPDEALQEVDTALEMLSPQVNEINEARLSRAEILHDLKRFDDVLVELSKIDLEKEAVPARRVRAHRLSLQASLGKAGNIQELETLQALVSADAKRDQLASTTRSEYFEARLVAARRALELQQAEAQTANAIEQNRIDKARRNQSLIFLTMSAFALCFLIWLLVSRQAERRSLEEKEAQNLELGALIEAKTRELTSNLNAQAEMAKALERKKRTEAIGLLAGNVAHDFNNLLQVMSSANETLGNPNSTQAQKAAVLDISGNSLNHAARIIRQLLAYSRQQDLASHPVRFSDYLKNTQALLVAAAGEENTFQIEDSSNNAAVLVDSAQLTTSLINLISNASDAMSEGGTVTLAAEVRQIDQSQTQHWNDLQPGEFLVLSVQDNGIGMNPDQVAQASEPFFTTKSLQFGTGLGLSSVYGFVRQSGGDLKIISQPNEGTLVRILLPLTTQQPRELESPAASVFESSGKRVLLVEDNQSVARVLVSVLQQIGMHSTHALSGQEAQARLRTDPHYDYVLSDVRMPGQLNGPALARWIQQEYPSITVMLMSGFNELGPEDTDLPLISKPFNIEQLKHFLAEHTKVALTD